MSESLWNDIDERLRGQLDAYMGRASAFPTLKLQTVEASILTDLLQMDWKKREFPFGIVDGRVEEMDLREHGDDLFSANGEARFKYDDGSHPVSLIPTRATVAIYPIIGTNEYYGISMRAFDVIAHMED